MYPPPRVIARDPKPNHPDADRDFVSSTTHYGSPLAPLDGWVCRGPAPSRAHGPAVDYALCGGRF